jgi:hypothetical protein
MIEELKLACSHVHVNKAEEHPLLLLLVPSATNKGGGGIPRKVLNRVYSTLAK